MNNKAALCKKYGSKVHPMRIELISSEPESDILSIELRVRL